MKKKSKHLRSSKHTKNDERKTKTLEKNTSSPSSKEVSIDQNSNTEEQANAIKQALNNEQVNNADFETNKVQQHETNQNTSAEQTNDINSNDGKEQVSDINSNTNENQPTNKAKKKAHTEKQKSTRKKIIIAFIIIILVAALCVGGYFLYLFFGPKFQDVTIELGTESVELNQFVRNETYVDKSEFVTDLSTMDFTKTGSYDIELNYNGITQKVKLNIVDTTPPTVEFTNLNEYIDYELNADDFIKSKSDLSEMTTSIVNPPEINRIGLYYVDVEVKDASNNITSQTCELNITRVVKEFTLELGNELKVEDILLNSKDDKDAISQNDIDKINKNDVGEYELTANFGDDKETIKVIIQDKTPPTLKLKAVTIYTDEKTDKDKFIESAKDASGDVTTTLKTDIDYSKIGTQDIVIEATDKYGNKVEEKTTLTIKEDNEGPSFYGLSNLSVSKNSSINYKKGVSAVDDRDGTVEFTVDSSKVNTSAAGTYYAKYTAKDKKGNTTTRNRKIVVNHDAADTTKKFNEFYNNYLAGKSVSGIISTIRSKISYNSNWGGSDPVWYGLTNYTGNCYVHAMLVKRALDKQGITNQLIYVTDKSHYWNLVYQNGKWRHYDATPTNHIPGPATDKEKANSAAMHGRTWSSSFPKAE